MNLPEITTLIAAVTALVGAFGSILVNVQHIRNHPITMVGENPENGTLPGIVAPPPTIKP